MTERRPRIARFSRSASLLVAVLALLSACSGSNILNPLEPQAIAWTPTLAAYIGPKVGGYSACYAPERTSLASLLTQAAEHCADPTVVTDVPDPANCPAVRPNKVQFRCAPQNFYSICYNAQTTTPKAILKMVNENCTDPVLIQHMRDTVNCSLSNPTRVSYRCAALSRAAAEMRPNMPLTGGVDGQFRF